MITIILKQWKNAKDIFKEKGNGSRVEILE